MSGHSKWATIKRKKGATDARRGAVFTKLANLISIAAKEKGGDLSTNFNLKMIVEKAKGANMPKDNIEKAIKRGTGEIGGEKIEELIYEGIGPCGVQFVIKVITSNKNRSAAEIRHIFTKVGGSFGSVMWNFEKKGIIDIDKENLDKIINNKDEFELELIDAGAIDLSWEDDNLSIVTDMSDLHKLKNFLESKNINTESAEIEFVAKEKVNLSEDEQAKIEKFIDMLDDYEDIGDYYSNLNN